MKRVSGSNPLVGLTRKTSAYAGFFLFSSERLTLDRTVNQGPSPGDQQRGDGSGLATTWR